MMDKKYFSPLELIKLATQHAYSAEYLLDNNAELPINRNGTSDTLAPFISLMYLAFEMTLKAYLAHGYTMNNQHKNLVELLELSRGIGLSNQDEKLIKQLARQFAFRKGIDYELWENRQEFQVFCAELVSLYERIQELMPLELQKDYSDL